MGRLRQSILSLVLLASTASAGPVECIKAGVEHVFVDTGEYILTETLSIPSNVTIYCQTGAVFVAAPGMFRGAHDSLVELKGSSNVTIIGCTFRMRKETYTEENGYPISEWRHALRLIGVSNIRLVDIRSESSGGDGCIIEPLVTCEFSECRNPSRNVTVDRMVATNNHRTGLAISSCENCTIRDSIFENTKGTATQSGVDVEPDHGGDVLKNIVFERCVARNNAGSAYTIQLLQLSQNSKPISVTFKDCSWSGVPVEHYGIRVLDFGSNQGAVKPKGFVRWDSSVWENN